MLSVVSVLLVEEISTDSCLVLDEKLPNVDCLECTTRTISTLDVWFSHRSKTRKIEEVKILAIEPHGDDILLSCFSVLRQEKATVDVLTLGLNPERNIHSDNPSLQLGLRFPTVTNVWHARLPEWNVSERGYNHNDVNRWAKSGLNPWQVTREMVASCTGFSKGGPLSRLKRFFQEEYEVGTYDLILAPLGLAHPYHMCVRLAVDECLPLNAVYYCESPYRHKKYVQKLIEGARKLLPDRGRTLRVQPIKETAYGIRKEKVKMFSLIYPTETAMLVWTKQQVGDPEEIFVGKEEHLRILADCIEEKPHEYTTTIGGPIE